MVFRDTSHTKNFSHILFHYLIDMPIVFLVVRWVFWDLQKVKTPLGHASMQLHKNPQGKWVSSDCTFTPMGRPQLKLNIGADPGIGRGVYCCMKFCGHSPNHTHFKCSIIWAEPGSNQGSNIVRRRKKCHGVWDLLLASLLTSMEGGSE